MYSQVNLKSVRGFTLRGSRIFGQRPTTGRSGMTVLDKGFTLIELLVVMSIIALMASLILASLAGMRKKGRDARRQSDLHQIQVAIEMYRNDNQLPATPGSQKLSDVVGFPTSTLPRDPLTGESYGYVATKLVGGENILCTSIPCTGYAVIGGMESEKPEDSVLLVKNSGNVVASSTPRGTVSMDVVFSPIASSTSGGTGTSTGGTSLAGVAWAAVPTPGPVQEAWDDVAFGAGLYVALGGMGSDKGVMTSPDGITWTPRSTPKGWYWESLAYGSSTFVAVAYGNSSNLYQSSKVMTSPDGITWTLRDAGVTAGWTSVEYTGTQFVAVSDDWWTNPSVMTSPDGITWTPQGNAVNQSKYSLTYGGGLLVAGGDGEIYTSGNGGVDWATRAVPLNLDGYNSEIHAVAYGSSTFVALSEYCDSKDCAIISTDGGVTWTRSVLPFVEAASSIVYDGTAFIVGNSWNTKFARSIDNGNTWSLVTAPGTADAMIYAGGKFVTVKTWGDNQAVMTSTDGITWTLRSTPTYERWEDVAYGAGTFVAVSGSGRNTGVMTSADGYNWTMRTTPTAHGWSSVAYGNGQFVATSHDNSNTAIATSPDGITWTTRTTPAGYNWWGVAYGNGTWVVTTVNKVATSPDGITWTLRSAPSNWWGPITFANGKFVAAAIRTSANNHLTSNGVMTSTDGISWTVPPAPAVPESKGITYGNGKFVVVGGTSYSGGEQTVLVSSDATTWTLQGDTDIFWLDVAFGDGNFAAVTYNGDPLFAAMSPDGSTWTPQTTDELGSSGVVYGNGVFVAVNGSGKGTDVMVAVPPTP
jgi:prepilin-type N-terminal cleavage/methylation domain-containing protein